MSNPDYAAAGMLGGYSPLDGTVEFYGRVNAFLKPGFVVADLGAGRAAWYYDDACDYRRSLRHIKGRVSKVIGVDVDRVVMSNPSTDVNIVLDGETLPFPTASLDVVIGDYVLEHLEDPAAVERELYRVLKPGGLFCGRTPHALNYVSIGARLVRNARHARMLRTLQPARKEVDVFDTRYRCNTLRKIREIWAPQRWVSYSYLYTAEPSYYFGSRITYRALAALHRLLPLPLVGNIFVFQLRRESPA